MVTLLDVVTADGGLNACLRQVSVSRALQVNVYWCITGCLQCIDNFLFRVSHRTNVMCNK
jgi:hypothetical protein